MSQSTLPTLAVMSREPSAFQTIRNLEIGLTSYVEFALSVITTLAKVKPGRKVEGEIISGILMQAFCDFYTSFPEGRLAFNTLFPAISEILCAVDWITYDNVNHKAKIQLHIINLICQKPWGINRDNLLRYLFNSNEYDLSCSKAIFEELSQLS